MKRRRKSETKTRSVRKIKIETRTRRRIVTARNAADHGQGNDANTSMFLIS